MTNIDIAAVLKTNHSKTDSVQNKISVNQSAWKKELESQLYHKQKNMVSSEITSSEKLSLNNDEVLKSTTDYFGLGGENDNSKHEVNKISQPLPGDTSKGVKDSLLTKTTVLYKSDVVLSGPPAAQSSSGALQNNTVQGSSRELYLGNQPKNSPASIIKPFSVRLLADGELLIRDYKQGLLSDLRLENMVADLKKIMNKDIEKVRINGEVVWQSDKKLPTDQYIIDLVQ